MDSAEIEKQLLALQSEMKGVSQKAGCAGASEQRLELIEIKQEHLEVSQKARAIFIPDFPGDTAKIWEYKIAVREFFDKNFAGVQFTIHNIFVVPTGKKSAGATNLKPQPVEVTFTDAGARVAILDEVRKRGRHTIDNVLMYPATTEQQRKRKWTNSEEKSSASKSRNEKSRGD